MAIGGINNQPAYPVDAYMEQNIQKAEEKKAAEAKAAEQQMNTAAATVTDAAAAATDPAQKADGFTKAPYKPMDMNNIIGPFKFAVTDKGTDKMNNLLNLVQGLFGQQGKVASIANNTLSNVILIDQQTQDAAKAAIAPDGYWGAEQTSARLLDFAKALSGGDASKIEELRGAVQKGYDAIADMFGGELPQVSLDTYDKVMQGFDAWAKESNPPANPTDPSAVQPGESVTDAE